MCSTATHNPSLPFRPTRTAVGAYHSPLPFPSGPQGQLSECIIPPFPSLQAHKDSCRSVSFSPTDLKFVTSSDDSTVRVRSGVWGLGETGSVGLWHMTSHTYGLATPQIHDFVTGSTESILKGHGGDVRYWLCRPMTCNSLTLVPTHYSTPFRWVEWHPSRGVVVSGSKDSTVKLWEPRTASCVATLHGHKNGIMQVWKGLGWVVWRVCSPQLYEANHWCGDLSMHRSDGMPMGTGY